MKQTSTNTDRKPTIPKLTGNASCASVIKACPHCKKEFSGAKKYCSDKCKYWFNQIKKDLEKHLPPTKKRNENYFFIITGVERYKRKGDGRRTGGCTQGSMAAMVYGTVEKITEVSEENIKTHFAGVWNFKPTYMRLGNGERVKKEDVLSIYGFQV